MRIDKCKGQIRDSGRAPRRRVAAALCNRSTPSPRPSASGKGSHAIRLRLAKDGPLRFISHLDTTRALTRALRRAGIPLDYTQGFHPRPRLSFGPALPLGFLSESEYVDVYVSRPVGATAVTKAVRAQLPHGLRLLRSKALRPKDLPLSNISMLDYEVQDADRILRRAFQERCGKRTERGVQEYCQSFLSRPSILTTKAGGGTRRTVDLAPFLEGIEVIQCQPVILLIRLRTSPRGAVGLATVLNALAGVGKENVARLRIVRTHVWIQNGQRLLRPLAT